MYKKIIFFIILLLSINLIYASDFTFSTTLITPYPYKGDLAEFKGTLTSDSGNYCPIQCQYNMGTYSGYVSDSGSYPPTTISPGNSQDFPFKLRAEEESGIISQTMVVTCDRIANYINCWPGETSDSSLVTLYFNYAGDKVCTTDKEKCADFQGYIGTTDCSCSFTKECRPDGNRTIDQKGCQTFCGNGLYESQYEDCSCSQDFTCDSDKMCRPNNNRSMDSDGCATYCGNGVCEQEYENCNTCAKDCKKCTLVTCTKSSECSEKYCVWGVCWNNPYRFGDSHCDNGENCANSPSDCKCQYNERCNNAGYCETYCGNGICEQNEIGVCSLDCNWCGDGTCQEKESCSSCSQDCGECRNIDVQNDNSIAQNQDNNQVTNQDTGNNNDINQSETINSSDNDQNINQSVSINSSITKKINSSNTKILIEKSSPNNSSTYLIIIGLSVFLIILVIIAVYLFNKKEKVSIKCPKCNKKIDADSRYCIYCGKRMK